MKVSPATIKAILDACVVSAFLIAYMFGETFFFLAGFGAWTFVGMVFDLAMRVIDDWEG